MQWRTIVTAVDAETGELLTYDKTKIKEIKQKYKIKRTKKTIYENTERGRIEITWLCTYRGEQLKLL